MAVSELEQRYVPLIKSQSVWQPWGPAGRYPLDDGPDEVSKAKRTNFGSWQRSHSWGGYTTSAQRQQFQADSQEPSQGCTSDLTADEASRADGGEIDAEGCADIFCRQDADLSCGESGAGLVNHEGHALLPQAPIDMQERALKDEESITQGGSKFTCGSPHLGDHDAAADPGQHSDTEVGLDELRSQCSSDLLGTSHPSENSWENSCDSPRSDGQWPQGFQDTRGAWPPLEAQDDLYDSTRDQPSYPSDAGPGEPGSRKRSRRGHRAGKSKSSSEPAPTEVTTLMVQNLPYALSRDDLVAELDRCGYGGLFNFCHVPRTFATGKNQGVAFVNFLSPEVAERFAGEWHGNRTLLGMSPLGKALRVKVATVQGIEACERIAQSRRMKRVKTGTFKPLVISGKVPEAG